MRPLSRALLAATGSAVALALAAGPALAAPALTLDPTQLSRGADPAIPYLDGKTVVDGAVRIPISAPSVLLLGKSGTGYVVATTPKNDSRGKLLRVEATGAITSLGRGDAYASVLSTDGKSVISLRGLMRDQTVVKVRDAITGQQLAKRRFDGYPSALDAQGTTVLLAGYGRSGTQTWNTATDTVTKISRRIGARASFELDLLASYTKDPYNGGCTVVSRLSNPSVQLWKSCDESVTSFSTDGSHLATVHILSDGLGPNAVTVRTVSGAEIGRYRTTRTGYFGALVFEDADTLLLQTTSRRKTANVRCTAAACDLATDVSRAEPYRTIS